MENFRKVAEELTERETWLRKGLSDFSKKWEAETAGLANGFDSLTLYSYTTAAGNCKKEVVLATERQLMHLAYYEDGQRVPEQEIDTDELVQKLSISAIKKIIAVLPEKIAEMEQKMKTAGFECEKLTKI